MQQSNLQFPKAQKDSNDSSPTVFTQADIEEVGIEDEYNKANTKVPEIPSDIKSRIFGTYGSNASADEDALDESDPTLLHVCLKLQRDLITLQAKSTFTVDQLRQLDRKINEISKDYLCDGKEALSIYRKERERAEKLRLEERLRSSPAKGLDSVVGPKRSKAPSVNNPPATTSLLDDSDSDESSTGVLGFLDEVGATEITVKGVTYKLRDMNIPKHWSGPMPRTVLRDFVAKIDKYAAISYVIISGQSRARRASVSISWRGHKRDEWTMDDVACSTDSQAEQYIATIALHSLTYPLTDGFISSSPASTSNSTSFRLLPACYRDLWDELEDTRKNRDDLINRTVWSSLYDLVKAKIQSDSKVCPIQPGALHALTPISC